MGQQGLNLRMHLTHITDHDYFDPDSESGTPFWISKSLQLEPNIELYNLHVSPPQKLLPPLEEFTFRCKQQWLKFRRHGHLVPDWYTRRAQYIADAMKAQLTNLKTDAIITSLTPLSAAYLETQIPIVYWTDAVYAALANFYPSFRYYHRDTHWDGHIVTHACLFNAKLLIFSSEWAARTAVEFYGVSHTKIKVVPFGGNLEITHTLDDIKKIIQARSKECIKLLFIGKNWFRKGGDIALRIAKALDAAGHAVELTIAGCTPDEIPLPSYVKCENFISKRNKEGFDKIKNLYQNAHFLLLPTRADACPNVFAEANAFGLPCITTYVGGIPTAIKDNVNGMMFSLEAPIKQFCDYISNLMDNYTAYEALSLSSFNEYNTRLNWKVASQQVKNFISEIL